MVASKKLVFFDTETTGKWNFKHPVDAPSQPYIVQLAALVTDLDGNELNYFTTLICPTNGYNFVIEKQAESVHGVSFDACCEFGVHINAAMLMFNQFMINAVAGVAHNIDFDAKMIASTCKRIRKPDRLETKPNICTMKIYTPIVKLPPKKSGTAFKWPTLTETHQHLYGEGFEGAHDALIDVRACKRVYFSLPESERRKFEAGGAMPRC